VTNADEILLAALMRPGQPCSVPDEDVLVEVERHRAAAAACDALVRSGHADAWPDAIRVRLRRANARRAIEAELLDTELRRVLDAAHGRGMSAVVIKGAALAHTHYRLPHLRPRSDSDLVIGETARDAWFALLADLGYLRSTAVEGELIVQQAQWTRAVGGGAVHAIDLHWRVFNPHLFGNLLAPGDLWRRSIPLLALGPGARAPHPADALILACVHRAAHHAGEQDLIWDLDVHLLVSGLADEAAAEAAAAIAAARLRAVAAASIDAAASRFGTRVPPPLAAVIAEAGRQDEPSAAFLRPGRRQVDLLVSDLSAVRGWRARVHLLREHLIPPPAYMRAKYRFRSAAWLPLAYVHRIVRGLPKWIRSQRP
jgi:hypothetical protein